jgi:cytochrome oxidase Cu insertion factor (SCO1/SenC/PrrC family)
VFKSLTRIITLLLALLSAACAGQATPQAIEVGVTAPQFTLPAATGETVSLSSYAGRPVLLFFHMAVG